MQITRMTCAMKNVFGCIATPRKVIYHKYLNEAIVGINKVLKPNLNVVDGLVGLGNYPARLNLIMAGPDTFSTDWVAAQVMGFNPNRLKFLRIAEKEKLGKGSSVGYVGEDPKLYRDKFPNHSIIPTEHLWSLEIGLLRLYARIVNDVLPPFIRE